MSDARDRVAHALAADERIVWRQEAPFAGIFWQKLFGALFLTLFAGMGTLAVLASSPLIGRQEAAWIGVGVGALFCLIGYGGLIAAMPDFLHGWRIDYVLTDRRLMIVSYRRVQAFTADSLSSFTREGDDAVGSFSFLWGGIGRSGQGYHVHMTGVREPARIERLIRTTLAAAPKEAPAPAAFAPDESAAPAHDLVTPALHEGERVLWRQTAPPLILLAWKLGALLLVSLFAFAGLAVLTSSLQASAHATASSWGGGAMGVLFIAIGLGLMSLVIFDIFASWTTQYALTNARVLVATPRLVQSYGAADFRQTERTGDADRGAIQFAWSGEGRRAGFRQTLHGVADPERVERLIVATLAPRN